MYEQYVCNVYVGFHDQPMIRVAVYLIHVMTFLLLGLAKRSSFTCIQAAFYSLMHASALFGGNSIPPIIIFFH